MSEPKELVIGKIEFATVTSGCLPSVAMPSGSGLAVPPDWRQLVQDRNHAVERQAVLETQVAALEAALSAIRALVQQWRERAERNRELAKANAREHPTLSESLWTVAAEQDNCADQLAALCPAPPED